MKTKTEELTRAALDWAVAKCEDLNIDIHAGMSLTIRGDGDWWGPSTDWEQGGEIIERERLQISQGYAHDEHKWSAVRYDHMFDHDLDCFMGGETPLIAAMRCYVASKLGLLLR
jgi:hypothetical protein